MPSSEKSGQPLPGHLLACNGVLDAHDMFVCVRACVHAVVIISTHVVIMPKARCTASAHKLWYVPKVWWMWLLAAMAPSALFQAVVVSKPTFLYPLYTLGLTSLNIELFQSLGRSPYLGMLLFFVEI